MRIISEPNRLQETTVREFFADGIDRRLRKRQHYIAPKLQAIPITDAQIQDIIRADNPKAVLRAHYRAWKNSD